MNTKNKIIAACVLGFLIFGIGGFFGGIKYQQGKSNSLAQNFSGQRQRGTGNLPGNGGMMTGANRNGAGGFLTGQILAKDDKSITVKLRDGGSKIIFYSASTQVQKMADAPLTDLAVGQQIVANGTVNSDGSVTAQTIQLRPNGQPSGSPIVQPSGN